MVKYLFNSLNDLKIFKNSDTTIITDIDGTISEIGSTHNKLMITPNRKAVLTKLTENFHLVGVITGRDAIDASNILQLNKMVYIGNHGLQKYINGQIFISPEIEECIPLIQNVTKILKNKLNSLKGISFDYKKLSVTVHYRQSKEPLEVKRKILSIITDMNLSSLIKIIEGRKLIEIRPKIGHDKGSVLDEIIENRNIKKIIYLGDDINDVNAFDTLKKVKENGIQSASICVDSDETPNFVKESADFYIKDVNETYRFF